MAVRPARAPKEQPSGQRTQPAVIKDETLKPNEPLSGSSEAHGSQHSRGGKEATSGQPAGQQTTAGAAGKGRDRPKQLLSKAVREAQAYNASTEMSAPKPMKQPSKTASKAASRPRKEVREAPPGLTT